MENIAEIIIPRILKRDAKNSNPQPAPPSKDWGRSWLQETICIHNIPCQYGRMVWVMDEWSTNASLVVTGSLNQLR